MEEDSRFSFFFGPTGSANLGDCFAFLLRSSFGGLFGFLFWGFFLANSSRPSVYVVKRGCYVLHSFLG